MQPAGRLSSVRKEAVVAWFELGDCWKDTMGAAAGAAAAEPRRRRRPLRRRERLLVDEAVILGGLLGYWV